MKQLVEYILTNIVDHPEDVVVEETESEFGYVLLNVSIHPEDMGKVIGKKGRVVDAIRKLVKIKAVLLGRRVHLNLSEPQSS